MIQTTTIGSYPKPDYLRIPNFVPKHPDPTRRYTEYLNSQTPEDMALLDKATHDNVRHQVDAGIDIPTDGETPRSHYVHYHLRHLGGIDFENLSERVTRGGAWTAKFPTIVGKVEVGPHFLVDDWKRAQKATTNPVKMSLPGPMTIIDSVVDDHYRDERGLAADLADALNYEIRALEKTGCRFIQIDEPVFARKASTALTWGGEMLERAFDGVSDQVKRVVHICCGYPSAVDLDDFPKAPREAYFELARMLDQSGVDCVSIEDAHRHNALELLERFPMTSVILGVVQIAATRIETTEDIAQRLTQALQHIDKDRLLAGPDCGLAMLDRAIVSAKLRNMCEAAKSL
ncbi:MAG: hypothetical protein ACR2PA_18700 [Hyphomicrobiaceae bacterium]